MFVMVMQRVGEDNCNGLVSIVHSPLNEEFVSEINVLTIVHVNNAFSYGRSFMDDHFIAIRHKLYCF